MNRPQENEKLSDEDVELIDDKKRAFLFESPRWTNLLLYTIAVFILIGIIWARFAILDVVTSGEGKVIPSSQVQVIQNLEGGILKQIDVKEGDTVKRGQILLTLDNTRFQSDFEQSRSKYLGLLASTARLKAEKDGQSSVAYPEIVQKEAPQLIATENALFSQRQENLKANIDTLQKSYQLALQEYNITKPLVEQGVMSQLELIRLEREVNDLKGKIDQANEDFQSKANQDLNDKMDEVSQLTAAMRALQDRLTRTTVRSPVKGIVKEIKISTIGGVIQPGMAIMEIVPVDDTLLIETKIRPRDIAFIHTNQKAIVKFTAYDYSIYGSLEGKVEYVSADTILEDKTSQTPGESYYKVLVRTNTNHLMYGNAKLPIIPGMTCAVDILTGKKSVLEYILKPIIKAKESALRER